MIPIKTPSHNKCRFRRDGSLRTHLPRTLSLEEGVPHFPFSRKQCDPNPRLRTPVCYSMIRVYPHAQTGWRRGKNWSVKTIEIHAMNVFLYLGFSEKFFGRFKKKKKVQPPSDSPHQVCLSHEQGETSMSRMRRIAAVSFPTADTALRTLAIYPLLSGPSVGG